MQIDQLMQILRDLEVQAYERKGEYTNASAESPAGNVLCRDLAGPSF